MTTATPRAHDGDDPRRPGETHAREPRGLAPPARRRRGILRLLARGLTIGVIAALATIVGGVAEHARSEARGGGGGTGGTIFISDALEWVHDAALLHDRVRVVGSPWAGASWHGDLRWVEREFPRWTGLERLAIEDPEWGAFSEACAFGWPWRAARHRRALTENGLVYAEAVALPVSRASGPFTPRPHLPLRPLWVGLAADVLVLGAAGVLLLEAAAFGRRAWRRRLGRCACCGYDRRGGAVGAVCPECGGCSGAGAVA